MNLPHDLRPTIFILDPSVAITGALIAARREASLFAGEVNFVLAIPSSSTVQTADVPEFVDIIRLPSVPLQKSVRNMLLYLPGLLAGGRVLARALKRHDCSRLQVNDFYLMEGVAARLFGFRGQIVTWVRIDPSTYGGVLGPYWLRVARRVSHRLIAVSRFIADRIPDGRGTQIVYDPVTTTRLAEPHDGVERRFVFIGNYIEGKGQDLAITAFHRLAVDFPRAQLHFHGGDMGLKRNRSYRASLKEQAASGPGASAIRFHGFIEDISQALDGALAAINCSHAESFSLTCQEAGAHGVAVIVTRSGGPQEIVEDGETGFLIDVRDIDALERSMRALLADPALANAMGKRAAALVRTRFSPDRFKQQLRDLFDLRTG